MTFPAYTEPSYRGRDQMTIQEFIEDVQKCHFRTALDTGANSNALFIWNIVRNWAGMECLDEDDLHRFHAETDGKTYEEIKAAHDDYMEWKRSQRR